MQIADIAKLPLAERIAAMELLWDSLSHDPSHEPSPDWHTAVLQARRAELEQGQPLDWDGAKDELRRRLAKPSH